MLLESWGDGQRGQGQVCLGWRQVRWKEWKIPKARIRALRALGIPSNDALKRRNSSTGHWRIARSTTLQLSLPNSYWTGQGLRGFTDNYHRLRNA